MAMKIRLFGLYILAVLAGIHPVLVRKKSVHRSANRTVLDVVLQTDNKILNEVVVLGMGR